MMHDLLHLEPTMRMWMVDPALMCDQHLLGEHGELHKHRPSFVKRHSIRGRVEAQDGPQIEPEAMQARHDALAAELLRRGFNHRSPFEQPDLSYLPPLHHKATVDRVTSLVELLRRCDSCRAKHRTATGGTT